MFKCHTAIRSGMRPVDFGNKGGANIAPGVRIEVRNGTLHVYAQRFVKFSTILAIIASL